MYTHKDSCMIEYRNGIFLNYNFVVGKLVHDV